MQTCLVSIQHHFSSLFCLNNISKKWKIFCSPVFEGEEKSSKYWSRLQSFEKKTSDSIAPLLLKFCNRLLKVWKSKLNIQKERKGKSCKKKITSLDCLSPSKFYLSHSRDRILTWGKFSWNCCVKKRYKWRKEGRKRRPETENESEAGCYPPFRLCCLTPSFLSFTRFMLLETHFLWNDLKRERKKSEKEERKRKEWVGKKKVRNDGKEPGRNVLLFHCAHIVTFGYSFFFSSFLCFSSLLLSTHFSSSRYYNSNRSFLLSLSLIALSFFFSFPISLLFLLLSSWEKWDERTWDRRLGKKVKKKEALRRQVEMMRNGKRCSSYACVFRKYKKNGRRNWEKNGSEKNEKRRWWWL